jgi:anthranilate phosphoribosyltransferase
MADINQYLNILINKKDLSFEQSKGLLDTIFNGDVPETQVAAFLTAMRIKSPTTNEIAGLASSLRSHAIQVHTQIDNLVDTCGTGGASVKTFNISTAAAIIAAGAGVYVAKHGNRCITSQCGSADVLAQIGVNIEAAPQTVTRCIEQAHIGFMFAPKFHPAMKYVQPVRKVLGFRTVFNILGPLANPAGVTAQVIGVPDEACMEQIAEALKMLGSKRAFVVHSSGLDEISTVDITKVVELKDGYIKKKQINPMDFGIKKATLKDLEGADAKTNAKIIIDILNGKDKGPGRDIVVLNASAAIIVANLADDFNSALRLANDAIDNGNAAACLDKLIKISNSND